MKRLIRIFGTLWLGLVISFLVGSPELFAGQDSPGEPAAYSSLRDVSSLQHNFASFDGQEGLRPVTYRTRPGDTFSAILERFGLSENDRRLWIGSIQKHYPVRRLPTGEHLRFYLTRPQKGKEQLKALEIQLDEDWVAGWERGEKGIVYRKRERPYEVEIKSAGGVVENSLFDDGTRLGLNPTLLSQVADIFSWEVDFNRDLQKGDTFKLLYEQKFRKGQEANSLSRVLAAELINAGQRYFAIYFEKEKGKGGYYDLEGRSLARAFLRFPLEFSRIGSYFSHSRFHPILKVDRSHTGVDFVAKRGTPVRAVGDGKVVSAGWRRGGYGRMIEIRHGGTYATRYAHLQGFARGIRAGAAVKKGQVIGYVGSSGMATGAHLHFELYKDRQYVDPLKFEIPAEDRIEPALRRLFDSAKQLFLAELAATPHS